MAPHDEGVPGEDATETTVEAEAAQRGAAVTIEPGDADEDADGHQLSLAETEEITVTVTSPDESRTKVYRVSVPQAEEVVSCLRGDVAAGFNLVVYGGGSLEDQLRLAPLAFKDRYNQKWLVERHGHRTPAWQVGSLI